MTYNPLLRIPYASRARKQKRDPCAYCYKPIKMRQSKYHYDEGYERRGKNTYFDLHVHCYNALLKLTIKDIKKVLENEFS